MERRIRGLLIAFTLGVLSVPLPALAQQPARIYRIGFLGQVSASTMAPQLEAFRQGLRDLGYVEGKNLTIEYRWAEGNYDRLPDLAADLVRLTPAVLVTHGTPGTQAAKRATTTIPIVMATSGDAVAAGLVTSLSRPGGNVTGSSFFGPELNAKRLELLKEAIPRATRVAYLYNPANPLSRNTAKAMEETAKSLRVKLQKFEVRAADDFAGVFAAAVRQGAGAVLLSLDSMLLYHGELIGHLATKSRLPTMGSKEHVEAGALMAYGIDTRDLWRRASFFVDRILKGAKPADLPVEQPMRFELVVNLKAAKALRLTIPPSVLVRADRVIQ